MKKFDYIFWGSIAFYILNGLISFLILSFTTSSQSLLQFLALSIILIIFTTRIILPKISKKPPKLAFFLEFAPFSLFIYILVLSTGGLTSPFLVLTHLFAIATAFLFTPKLSASYVFITILFLMGYLIYDPTAQLQIAKNPALPFFYALIYFAILPFSQYISKIYHQKDAWVQDLSNMLATSKKQEENLLKNIQDAVIALSPNMTISFINWAFSEKFGFREKDVISKKIDEVLKFRDKDGSNLDAGNLQLNAVISTKNEIHISNVQIIKKDGNYLRVSIKAVPVIDNSSKVVGLLIIIKDYSIKDLALFSYYDSVAAKLSSYSPNKLVAIARDLLLFLSLESGIEKLSSFINVTKILENEIYNLKSVSFKKGVTFKTPHQSEKPLMFKQKVVAPQISGTLPDVFIQGTENLLNKAFFELIKVAIALAFKDSTIYTSIDIKTDTLSVNLLVKSDLPSEKLNLLHLKFFNEFLKDESFKDFTGLEINLVENIFEMHGGSLNIKKVEKGILLSVNLIHHEASSQYKNILKISEKN